MVNQSFLASSASQAGIDFCLTKGEQRIDVAVLRISHFFKWNVEFLIFFNEMEALCANPFTDSPCFVTDNDPPPLAAIRLQCPRSKQTLCYVHIVRNFELRLIKNLTKKMRGEMFCRHIAISFLWDGIIGYGEHNSASVLYSRLIYRINFFPYQYSQ